MPICPSCGTDNSNEMNFCGKCGTSLTGATGQLSPDTIMEGRYIIVKVIGRGGMGAVYLALDQRLNNIPVAIKEMSTGATGAGNLQRAVESFKLEAALLINLEHQALPRIRDFFQKDDRWYLVMDYIEGETLKEIVEKRGPISDTQILDWAKQLCEILDYLHSQQPPIIFRDLKPSNIMLTTKGVIKLIDFGIARHFKPGQSADTIAFGSTGFAPPEQYGNSQTDARTDIFALGATLHYLVTGIDPGSRPFNFEPPSKRVNISPSLEYAIMKAVEMQVERRFESTKEMMDALISGREEAAAKFNKVSAKQEEINNVEDCSSQAVEHSVTENKKEVAEEPQNISPEVKQDVTVGLLEFSEEDLTDLINEENIGTQKKEDESQEVLENSVELDGTQDKKDDIEGTEEKTNESDQNDSLLIESEQTKSETVGLLNLSCCNDEITQIKEQNDIQEESDSEKAYANVKVKDQDINKILIREINTETYIHQMSKVDNLTESKKIYSGEYPTQKDVNKNNSDKKFIIGLCCLLIFLGTIIFFGIRNSERYSTQTNDGSLEEVNNTVKQDQHILINKITIGIQKVNLVLKALPYKINYSILPANATNKEVTWASNNPSVAKVDNLGNVIPLKPGKAVITVKSVEGGVSSICNVNVRLGYPSIGAKLVKFSLYEDVNGKKKYKNRFKSKISKNIGWEIAFDFKKPKKRINFIIRELVIDSKGNVVSDYYYDLKDYYVEPNWDSSLHWNTLGSSLSHGTYWFKLYGDGKFIGQKSFEVF